MNDETKLCGPCSSIDVLGRIKAVIAPGNSEPDPVTFDAWHKTLDAVHEAAKSCELCALVLQGWRESRELAVETGVREGMIPSPEDLPSDIMDVEKYRQAGGGGVGLDVGRRARETLDGRKAHDSFFLVATCKVTGTRSSGDANDDLEAELRLARDADLPVRQDAALDLVDELVAEDPLSPRSLTIARVWLDHCVKTHGQSCRPSHTPAKPTWEHMPTRILDVASSDTEVYLRVPTEARPEDGRYVALSHCWGIDGTPFLTTRANLQQRMEGIKLDELPPTFREAVTITKQLGLKHLWIDSLCIIQRDLEDWQIESAKMSSVYQDAYLVLGAAAGLSDAQGFVGPRKRGKMVSLPTNISTPITVQLLPPYGDGRASGRRWICRGGSAPDPLAAEPVTQRAWCLQERYLPMRALQYGSHQMFWECEKMKASEEGDVVGQNATYLKNLCANGTARHSVFKRGENTSTASESVDAKWSEWYHMVESYSSRDITSPEDRLPAVAGLAKAVASVTGERDYMAGLWKTGLLEGLIWHRKDSKTTLRVPASYIAPSWSWASVQGTVRFPIYDWYLTRAYWKAIMANFEPLARFARFDSQHKDKDIFGRLESASLVIKASLVPVLTVQQRPPEPPSVIYVFGQDPYRSSVTDKVVELQLEQNQHVWIEAGFDTFVDDHLPLFVVFLTRLPHIFDDGFLEHRFGLLLRKLDNGTYRRVGFVDGCFLETHNSALSRWKKTLPDYRRERARPEDQAELEKDIAETLASLERMGLDYEKSRTSEQLEYLGYTRASREHDMDDTEPPNSLAPNPAVLDLTELVLV